MNLLKLDDSRVVDLYTKKRMSATAIGRLFGVCNHVIRKRLRKQGVELRSQSETIQLLLGKTSPKILSEIVSLYKDCWSEEEIAQKFGISASTVSRQLRNLNLTRSSEESKRRRGTTSYGSRNVNWRGGKRHGDGYVFIREKSHPRCDSNGYIAEHILVWEKAHNRPVPKGYIIHHINGIRNDNRPSNLVAVSRRRHGTKGQTLVRVCQEKIRELEIENKQLQNALENSQSIFYLSEN